MFKVLNNKMNSSTYNEDFLNLIKSYPYIKYCCEMYV